MKKKLEGIHAKKKKKCIVDIVEKTWTNQSSRPLRVVGNDLR